MASRPSKRQTRRRRRQAKSFVQCVRQFLTPEVFKQAQRARQSRRRSPRWQVQPLVFVLLTMTWTVGDSTPERFEIARAFYVACHASRKRPGQTLSGFQAALSKMPVRVVRTVATAIRRQLLVQLGDRLITAGWRVFGCDGSRVECPRAAELEQRLGRAGKDQAAPTAWVTALVHLSRRLHSPRRPSQPAERDTIQTSTNRLYCAGKRICSLAFRYQSVSQDGVDRYPSALSAQSAIRKKFTRRGGQSAIHRLAAP